MSTIRPLCALLVLSTLLTACDPGEPKAPEAPPIGSARALRPEGALRPLRAEGDPIAAPGLNLDQPGVRHVVVQKGAGERPAPGAEIRVHQTGWLRQGESLGPQIANSRADGAPATFLLAAARSTLDATTNAGLLAAPRRRPLALPGLLQMVSEMQPGERRWIVVPAEFGYGSLGLGDLVPPDSDLVFDLELVSFANIAGR